MAIVVQDHVHLSDAADLVVNLNSEKAFFGEIVPLARHLLRRLTARHAAIDVSAGAWERYDRAVTRFLALPHAPEPALTRAQLLRHAGVYRGTRAAQQAAITTDGARLYLQLPATSALPLVRIGGGEFCARGLPIDIRFTYGAGGRARGFRYQSRMINEPIAGSSWVRA